MLFYCEFLKKIKICHLHVQLTSAVDISTSLTIFDRKTLRLRHGFQSFALAMPASVDVDQKIQLKIDETDACSFSVRLKAPSSFITLQDDNPLPFPDAAALTSQTLDCTCGYQILPSGLPWRQLPSEHWQEMMDSWHCHAGISQHGDHERHEQYTLPSHIVDAARSLVPAPGKPFVGLTYMLVHPDDVKQTTVRSSLERKVVGLQDQKEGRLQRLPNGESLLFAFDTKIQKQQTLLGMMGRAVCSPSYNASSCLFTLAEDFHCYKH
jgi:hypothetical protein